MGKCLVPTDLGRRDSRKELCAVGWEDGIFVPFLSTNHVTLSSPVIYIYIFSRNASTE